MVEVKFRARVRKVEGDTGPAIKLSVVGDLEEFGASWHLDTGLKLNIVSGIPLDM